MLYSWRSSRFVMWVPPNHLLNPIRLLFILLWGAVSISLLKEKEAKFTFIRLPFVRHLNFWTTLNVTNWVGKAGWWSPSLSPSCLSASSLGGRPSPSRCRGTSPCGGCWERLSSWSTPSSSSTFSNPTMCHSQKRSTSGWGLRLEVPQVCSVACETLNLPMINHSHDRDASEAPRSTRCGKRRGGRGRSAGGRWEQRGEERPVKRNCLK